MVHRDPKCHQQLLSMRDYILEVIVQLVTSRHHTHTHTVHVSCTHNSLLQELNVRSLVLAEDDSKYGISLQAEPDCDRLGKRLKADFKTVSPAVKGLYAIQTLW